MMCFPGNDEDTEEEEGGDDDDCEEDRRKMADGRVTVTTIQSYRREKQSIF